MPKVDARLLAHAKQMRTELTPAEARLWYRLRAGRLDGVKFVRQSVRRPYIADFVARFRKLVIEVDGDTHGLSEEYDARRTAQLERLGYRVLRFTNVDVMRNVEGVLQAIVEALRTSPLPSRFARHPLPGGEREHTLPSPLWGVAGRPCSQHGLNSAGRCSPATGGRAEGEVGRGAEVRVSPKVAHIP